VMDTMANESCMYVVEYNRAGKWSLLHRLSYSLMYKLGAVYLLAKSMQQQAFSCLGSSRKREKYVKNRCLSSGHGGAFHSILW
jgi:hypothetical protein